MIKKNAPYLIIMRGLSGSGKSYLARQLAKILPATHLNSDIIRKAIAGYAPLSRTKANIGEGIYTPQMSYETYQSLLDQAESILKTGASVIVDATFLHPKSLAKQQKLAQDLAVSFLIIDIQVSIACLRRRVAKRFAQGNDPSEADVAVLEQQFINYCPLKAANHVVTIHNENGFEFSALIEKLSAFL
jgi:predicted kinase